MESSSTAAAAGSWRKKPQESECRQLLEARKEKKNVHPEGTQLTSPTLDF